MDHAGFTSEQALADKAEISRETVNNIRNRKVDATADVLEKIAHACGVPVPIVEWRFTAAGRPQEPRTPAGWVEEASAALDEARKLLAGVPVRQSEQVDDVVRKAAKKGKGRGDQTG